MKPYRAMLITIVLLTASCGLIKPKQLYPGPERPESEIAVLHPQDGINAELYTNEQNDKRLVGVAANSRSVALAPGRYKAIAHYSQQVQKKVYDRHEKKMVTRTQHKRSTSPSTAFFELEAGEHYWFKVRKRAGHRWRAELVERSSGNTVSK